MKYNTDKTGKRIQDGRESLSSANRPKKKMSQEEFGEEVGGYSRKAVASWEHGETIPPLDAMLKMCNLFKCDLDYLLGAIDCRTKEIARIADMIPFNENVIERLLLLKKYSSLDNLHNELCETIIGFINALIIGIMPSVSSQNELELRSGIPMNLSKLKKAYIINKAIDIPNDPDKFQEMCILDYERVIDMIDEASTQSMVIDANNMRITNEIMTILDTYMHSITD